MDPPLKVVVDECVGPESHLLEQFRAWLDGRPAKFLYLAEEYPGIPDVEILDKLLGSGVVLITNDCVLHNRVCASHRRSFTLNEQGQLTRRRLKGVMESKRRTAPSVSKHLEDSYLSPPHEIARRLMLDLPEKRLKGLRTARRRIRSYFGSQANIARVALTIDANQSRDRILCGFALRVAGHAGVKGLAASEGYCAVPANTYIDDHCVTHGLRAVFCLHLDQVPLDIFLIPNAALDLCNSLQTTPAPDSGHVGGTLEVLLTSLREVQVLPCVKGRFHDAMKQKLRQLAATNSNEVRSLDFGEIDRRVVGANCRIQ
jgi:hypothetical protein